MSENNYSGFALAAKDITKRFGSVTVLHGVQFFLKKGEIHSLLGANGAGKSTLLNIIDGILTDYDGELYVDGDPVHFEGPKDAIDKGIGMVHQELSVLPNISVAENIFLGRLPLTKIGTVDWKKLNENAGEILSSMGLNEINPADLLEKLSVADQQMVEIARIISQDVPTILLDEPTSALSEAEIRRLMGLMKKLKDEGKSIVFITHKLDEILEISDRVTVIRDGYFVDTIDVIDRSPAAQKQLVQLMIGDEAGDMSDMFPEKNPNPKAMALEVKNLTKEGIFKDISFNVHEGEVIVLTGLKGARRTETVRCVFGADGYDSGEVCIYGKTIPKTTIKQSIENEIAFVTENRKGEGLVLPMAVKANISLSTIDDVSKGGMINYSLVNKKADDMVQKIGIKVPSIDASAQSLSGGNQQKVVIAKWMAAAPKIFILDEPTRGIDVGAKREIYKLVRKMADDGAAIVVVSSEIPEVLGMGDRVYVMSDGKMIGELTGDALTSDAIMHMMFEQTV